MKMINHQVCVVIIAFARWQDHVRDLVLVRGFKLFVTHHLSEGRLNILANICLTDKQINAVLHWCCVITQVDILITDDLVVGLFVSGRPVG